MSIQIADSLFATETAAIHAACHSWLYADGLNDDRYVLDTLKNVPHEDIADEVFEWLENSEFTPNRNAVLARLAEMQKELELTGDA